MGNGAVLPVMEAQGSGQIINLGLLVPFLLCPQAQSIARQNLQTGYFGWLTAGKLENPCDLRNPGVVESELASTITHVETMK